MNIPFYKKILSFIIPIKLIKGKTDNQLELKLFCNQLLLTTKDAVYSNGIYYTPFRKSFQYLKHDLKNLNNFLLLGTGLGSALKILQTQYNLYPESSLVDINKEILSWSESYMNLNSHHNVKYIHADGFDFLKNNNEKFDLIAVDLFNNINMVPDCIKIDFIENCLNHLSSSGIIIFNMIFNSKNEKIIVTERLQQFFNISKIIELKVNNVFICKQKNI